MRDPTTVTAVTVVNKVQSTLTVAMYPASPAKDFIAITSREVPTAAGMAKPPSNARAGTTRKPPPAPTSPVITPTTKPSRTTRRRGRDRGSSPGPERLFFFPRSMLTAVATIMRAKAIISKAPGRWPPTKPPRKAPTMPAAPKTTPVRHRTLPARVWAKVLISEVTPTMNNDAAMASLGSVPAT